MEDSNIGRFIHIIRSQMMLLSSLLAQGQRTSLIQWFSDSTSKNLTPIILIGVNDISN